MKKARIFDIRRFSTHDGSGIRTTVFMKGCPLDCIWCHNPEGISRNINLLYFKNKCMNCHICIEKCPRKALSLGRNGILIDQSACDLCGICTEECPGNALNMDCMEFTLEQVLVEVMNDQPFFKYGGGVTITGGEPLLQADFVIELFKGLKRKGIHTAVETSLFGSNEDLKKMLPYLDEIFCDLKLLSSEDHFNYTGVSNLIILENLEAILVSEEKTKVIVRTPLIPDHTANEENITRICSFITGIYPDVQYELLNYNPLASSKYHLIGREYCFEDNPKMYSVEEIEYFRSVAIKAGIKNMIED
ncbi:MAG: glycyl-radical enzyme activating protein [Eubacteriaceae bacterium]|nr:glycyl-radical enzyme activating protein [Eubacteriaceae bacterium]